MTPRLFEVLCRRKYRNDRIELTNAALISMTLININRPKNKKVIKIEDIIGKDILQEIKFETKFQEAKIQEENEEADVLDILKSLHREKS